MIRYRKRIAPSARERPVRASPRTPAGRVSSGAEGVCGAFAPLISWAMLPVVLAAAALLLLGNRGSAPSQCRPLTPEGGDLEGVRYREIVTGGGDPGKPLPMIVSLHGLGYDGRAHIKWLQELPMQARVILPDGFYMRNSDPTQRTWWPSYSNASLEEASRRLAPFVEQIARCRRTAGKPIITGHSMGGFVALDFAIQFPELVSAAVPVAATRSKALWDKVPVVPIRGVHGTLDGTYGAAKAYYDEMSGRGLDVTLTPVSGGGHRMAPANAEAWLDTLQGI